MNARQTTYFETNRKNRCQINHNLNDKFNNILLDIARIFKDNRKVHYDHEPIAVTVLGQDLFTK